MTLRSTPCPFVFGDKHCGYTEAPRDGYGCDKTFATCRDKFHNEVRFGGIPGREPQGPVCPDCLEPYVNEELPGSTCQECAEHYADEEALRDLEFEDSLESEHDSDLDWRLQQG